MISFVNVKKLRNLLARHTRLHRRKYEETLAAKKGIQELLRRQAALHNSRSAARDTAAQGLIDGANEIQQQYSQRRHQLDQQEATLRSEQEGLIDQISRSGGSSAAAIRTVQGVNTEDTLPTIQAPSPSHRSNSGTCTQRSPRARTQSQSSQSTQQRSNQRSNQVLGMSDPVLLNSLTLLAQHPSSLSDRDREYRDAALTFFAMMREVADHPTDRPFYSDLDLVNILPSRLRPLNTQPSPAQLGRMPACSE